MNGIHDLGGLDGFTLPERDPNEPAFKHEWERLVFGAYLAHDVPFSIDESRFGVESIPAELYLSMPYYARWLYRSEQLLIKYGVLTAEELAGPDSQGIHVFPDTIAMGLGLKPQHCYNVMFAAPELWGSRASAKDRIYIDLFEDYLEAAS